MKLQSLAAFKFFHRSTDVVSSERRRKPLSAASHRRATSEPPSYLGEFAVDSSLFSTPFPIEPSPCAAELPSPASSAARDPIGEETKISGVDLQKCNEFPDFLHLILT